MKIKKKGIKIKKCRKLNACPIKQQQEILKLNVPFNASSSCTYQRRYSVQQTARIILHHESRSDRGGPAQEVIWHYYWMT
jgi:hypothetical protein